jgi:uncharacterized protein (TIGR03083 family)
MLSYVRYYGAIAQAAAETAELVQKTDRSQPVPTCPDWTFADLVAHLGAGHRWVTSMVSQHVTEALPHEAIPDSTPPDDPAEAAEWLRDGALRLIETIRDEGPESSVWTLTGEHRAGFWARRMAHETSVHSADAALTAGRTVTLPADLSADGISEWLGLLTFAAAGMRPALRGTGETMHFHSTDGWLGRDGEWFVRRTPEGIDWEHGHAKADVAVRGDAADLMLLLTRRLPLDSPSIEVLGDRAVLEYWLANTAF